MDHAQLAYLLHDLSAKPGHNPTFGNDKAAFRAIIGKSKTGPDHETLAP